MIEFISYSDCYRNFAKNILENSFPKEERPDFDILISRKDAEYNFCIILDNGNTCGIIGYWHFDDFVFCEHFAIDSKLRNNGVGGCAFDLFLKHTNKLIVLEVETPDNELSARRINFYKRHNMVFNDYFYMQPLYGTQEFVMQQYIMSTKKLSKEEFESVKIEIYRNVYKVLE